MEQIEISQALKECCRLHAFRSQDGLMVHVGKDSELGKHPGVNCVTGNNELGDKLDARVKRGRSCQAWSKDDEVVVELSGMSECMIAFTQAGNGFTFIEAFTEALSAPRVYVHQSRMD